MKRTILLAGAGAVSIAASSLAPIALAQAPNGNVANGRALYETTGCYQCHGYVGQGGVAGPKLVPPMAFEPFELQLRTPRQLMPPYSAAVLSPQQAADIYAFVRTFPAPVNRANVPLLQ